MSGLQNRVRSSAWRVNKKRVQILGHQSADLVGTVVVRHTYAYCAQWVICVRPRARRSIPLEFNGEMSFDVLFCSAQVEGSILLIYRKEMGMDCTISRGLRFAREVAICEGLL